jgi:NADPH2:quinone reductase
MKAVWIEQFSEPGSVAVKEVPSPEPGTGQVLLDVHAAGVNFADTLMVSGRYQVKPPFPFSPGMEVAGVVRRLGADVTGLAIGDRVMSMCGWGAFAEQICVGADMTFPVPQAVSLETAAAFPITYGTVYHAFRDRAALKHDEWLVVHGAGSGVGLNAVELGKLFGARVVAVASSDSKLQAAHRYGADVLIDYRTQDVRASVLALTGDRGADVIFDPVGGAVFDSALHYIAPEGRVLVVGFASGTISSAPANLVLLKGCQIVGVNTALLIRDALPEYRRRFDMMLRWVADGRLNPVAPTMYALERAAQALDDIAQRRITGKAVIRVR